LNSLFGVLSLTLCFGLLLVSGLLLPQKAPPEDHPFVSDWKNFLGSLSIALLCFTGHPCLPTVYAESKQKTHTFRKPMVIGIGLAGAFYTAVGSVGFHFFGQQTQNPFTLNVGHALDGSLLPGIWLANPLVCFGIAVKTIAMFPFGVETICLALQGHSSPMTLQIMRFTIWALAMVGLLFSRDHIMQLSNILGNFLTAMTSIVTPCLCYLKLFHARNNKDNNTSSGNNNNIGNTKTVLVILVALVGLCIASLGITMALVFPSDAK
ncbi:unnamed protein product, partial [Polarella glacialis]